MNKRYLLKTSILASAALLFPTQAKAAEDGWDYFHFGRSNYTPMEYARVGRIEVLRRLIVHWLNEPESKFEFYLSNKKGGRLPLCLDEVARLWGLPKPTGSSCKIISIRSDKEHIYVVDSSRPTVYRLKFPGSEYELVQYRECLLS